MLGTLHPSNPGSPQAGMGFEFGPRSPMGLARQDSFTREDHRAKEQGLLRNGDRTPRRSHTYQDYHVPPFPTNFTLTLRQGKQGVYVQPPTPPAPVSPPPSSTPTSTSSSSSHTPDTVAATESAHLNPSKAAAPHAQHPTQDRPPRPPQRPSLGPPRRSYSVVDYEPLPHHHRPPIAGSGGLSLMDLPVDLHYVLFDFLDPIDSTCMGLTNKHFYTIHRRLHGTVPLSIRRDGPNELEWAWHLHIGRGQAVDRGPAPKPVVVIGGTEMTARQKEKEESALAKLRIKGQAYCRKCGVCRCELHKHIQEWMGEGMEYCSVKKKFGPVAPEGSKSFCYMSAPRDPTRCGRHKARKSMVLLK